MPSRAYTSFLFLATSLQTLVKPMCHCPLGLIPHFYDKEKSFDKVAYVKCQCPLGLIPHFYFLCNRRNQVVKRGGVNALSGLYLISTAAELTEKAGNFDKCQCPLGLIPHFYGTPSKT